MPIFEYRCKGCNAVTEVLIRRAGDERAVKCGECGSAKLERMLSAAAVAVKSEDGCPVPKCGDRAPCCARTGPHDTPACKR